MKRVGFPAGASASRLILKTKVAPFASAACLLAVVASAQILLLDDMELMAPRFALSITTGPADLSENIANFTALLISEAEHDRKIRAKGLNLKREETLADNAKSFAADRDFVLVHLAWLQEIIERAPTAGSLKEDDLERDIVETSRLKLSKRKPVAADFTARKREIPEHERNQNVELKSGELEFRSNP